MMSEVIKHNKMPTHLNCEQRSPFPTPHSPFPTLGIIFTGGESPQAEVIKKVIEQDAILIAADSGLAAAQSAGLEPDWVIGDMDSIDEARLSGFPPQRVIRHVHDKDFSDTELAFSHAIEKGCDEVWIIGGGGGRIDHLFALRALFERDVFPLRWITDKADIRCVDFAAKNELVAVLEKNAVVSVFPLGDRPWKVQSEGLKWPLAGLPWDRGFFSLSNTAPDGKFSVKAQEGRFMLILPLPAIY